MATCVLLPVLERYGTGAVLEADRSLTLLMNKRRLARMDAHTHDWELALARLEAACPNIGKIDSAESFGMFDNNVVLFKSKSMHEEILSVELTKVKGTVLPV